MSEHMRLLAATELGRLETPAARLVTHADAPRHAWLAARWHGITATDLVAIMGQSSYKTAFDVWTDKVMEPGDEDQIGEAAIWGQRLEEPVAQEWAHRHGVKIRRIGLVANESRPWMLASLDRIVHGCDDGKCALEVKTRNLYVAEAWDRGLPEDVRTQALWQLAVSGLDHVHVAALIGGQRMVEHRVDRDPGAELKLIDAAALVWEAVETGTPPNLPAELWSSDFLDKRHPDRAGEIEIDPVTLATVDLYQKTVEQIRVLEETKAKYRTLLVGALGDHETATSNGRPVYSFKAQASTRLDKDALAERYPDAAADPAVWKTTSTRTFRIAPKKGN